MDDTLPVIYVSGLLIFLFGLGVFVIIQIVKTRKIEGTFNKLQKKLQNEKGTTKDYYALGSIYLNKSLYVQAIGVLQKALKASESEEIETENKALIHNALGFAYFAQEQVDLAIRNYKDAIKLYPEYTIALNNLGNAYERKQMANKALEIYEETLKYEPKNSVAKKRVESLRKRFVESK